MAPKKQPPEEALEEPVASDEPPRPTPVWIYGINDHLVGPQELPAGIEYGKTLRGDYQKLCQAVDAIAHPALKLRPRPSKPERGSRGNIDMAGAAQWGAREPASELEDEQQDEYEPPVLKVSSMLLDKITMQLLGLLLPQHSHQISVLCFSGCRLDVEMLELLYRGLVSPCNIEALQIEWNPLELPLPSVEEMDKAEEDKAEEEPGPGAAGPPESEEAGVLGDSHDLEVRERRRYLLNSQRTLRSFLEWILQIFEGDLDAAWAALEKPGDAAKPLHSGDFQDALEARLGTVGSHVVVVFDALDGPDYGDIGGRVSLAALRRALETLPDEPVREATEDPIGAALAPFVGSDCILESLSLRACGLTRLEMGAMGASLCKASAQLRILNLWDNYLCSRAMEPLAAAFEDFRGLEYLGLGRNRISDKGLATICTPFHMKFIDPADLKPVQDRIKQQVAQMEAAEKAKAKAKPKPPAEPGERVLKEMPYFLEELKEIPAEEEGGESLWVLRRPCELKTINLCENPIKDGRALQALQPLGPEGAEILLRATPVASTMVTKKQDLGAKGRRASGVVSEGWVLRLL